MTRERQDAASQEPASIHHREAVPWSPRPERGVGRGTFSMPPGGGPVSGLGSALRFFRGMSMSARQKTNSHENHNHRVSLITQSEWKCVIRMMNLSPRQAQIVQLLLQGHPDKEIASALRVSFSTVRTHLRQIFARERVHDRLQLVLRVLEMARTRSINA